MMPTASAVGALATALVHADTSNCEAEHEVDTLLERLFHVNEWRPRFPRALGWDWRRDHPVNPDDVCVRIDVFEVVESTEARAALKSAGFGEIVLHDHDAAKFLTCTCRPRGATR